MQKPHKRNHNSTVSSTSKKKPKNSPKQLSHSTEPYPNHPNPTPEQCLSARDSLLSLHGFPQEFAKYRKIRSGLGISSNSSQAIQIVKSEFVEEKVIVEDDEKESVLDGLVNTLLSQNTTDANSRRAFANLKAEFPNWEAVLAAESKVVENAIKCGGLAVTKAACIKNLLTGLLERKGKLCLEYLRDLSIDEIKGELSGFKGIGPKTVACVLMFNLQRDDFPVDTHVFRITKSMGWVPENADREKTYLHLNKRIPSELKFDLNCLFVTHGKVCQRCSKKLNEQQSKLDTNYSCPLFSCSSVSDMKKELLT
ncbi:DNA-(apurinic or apyrimidinic site) lyase [Ranunculus cassubicifolius]